MNIWSHSIVLMHYIRIYYIGIQWSMVASAVVLQQQQQQAAPWSWVAQLSRPNAVQTTYFTFPQVIDISITLHFPVELA